MAYQKLQVGLGVNVIPSDTINIPNVSGATQSGTVTSVVANQLKDTAGGFTNALVGYIVYNNVTNTIATVTSVTDVSTLVLSANIMLVNSEAYTLYADDNAGCVLYVGGAGLTGLNFKWERHYFHGSFGWVLYPCSGKASFF